MYVPVLSPDPAGHLDPQTILSVLGPILDNPSIAKTGHNLKYDYMALRRWGARLSGIAFDSMIAGHLLNLQGNSLDNMAATRRQAGQASGDNDFRKHL